jgi:hypothetical protein
MVSIFLKSVILLISPGLFTLTSNGAGAYSLNARSIVQNGSFEIFNGWPLTPWYGVESLMTSWPNAPEGVNYASIAAYVYQPLATTRGQMYRLSFFAADDLLFSRSTTIDISWNGQSVATFTTQPHDYDPGQNRGLQIVWEHFSTAVVANGTSSILGFTPTGTEFYLDAVEVVPIPEPHPYVLWLMGMGCIGLSTRLKHTRTA